MKNNIAACRIEAEGQYWYYDLYGNNIAVYDSPLKAFDNDILNYKERIKTTNYYTSIDIAYIGFWRSK